jgi:cytochrome c oxidase subunit 2
VGRFWSLLFLMVPVLGVAAFVLAMLPVGPLALHWLPDNINPGGDVIDKLFIFILCLTGVIFVGTGLLMFAFLWRYDARRNADSVKYTHGSHSLEVVWSILPAATLLFIAIFQMNAWAKAKVLRPMLAGPDGRQGTVDDEPQPPLAQVTARQFEWRIQYAGIDGKIGTPDDVYTVNELHVPVRETVVLSIQSMDVLHSFFLPNLRIKQDVVPGMQQFVWFSTSREGQFDLVCAELCGWGHYKMRGRLIVQSRAAFDQWLNDTFREQERSEFKLKQDSQQ